MRKAAIIRYRLWVLLCGIAVCNFASAQAEMQKTNTKRVALKELKVDTNKQIDREELKQPEIFRETSEELKLTPERSKTTEGGTTVPAKSKKQDVAKDSVTNRVRTRRETEQRPTTRPEALATPADTTKERYVYLLHADETRFNQRVNPDAQILVGDVIFRHDSMYMYCDSALFYENSNSLDAYGNVRMHQGDTLHLYGDRLHYNGDEMLAKVRDNVVMIDKQMTLTTDSLNYDRTINLGYYFNWGTVEDTLNVLTSEWGEYDTQTNEAIFNYEVTLTNPNFVLTSDTLHYNTKTQIATIVGPSNIDSDKNNIYSTLGRYYTAEQHAELLNRSVLTNEDKRLVGDSIYYDRTNGYGEAFYNVVMDDFAGKTRLTGDYTYYNELSDSAYATNKAVAIDYSQGDSLFIHGDTLRLLTRFPDTDSVFRVVQAFHKVRIYREDVQVTVHPLLL